MLHKSAVMLRTGQHQPAVAKIREPDQLKVMKEDSPLIRDTVNGTLHPGPLQLPLPREYTADGCIHSLTNKKPETEGANQTRPDRQLRRRYTRFIPAQLCGRTAPHYMSQV